MGVYVPVAKEPEFLRLAVRRHDLFRGSSLFSLLTRPGAEISVNGVASALSLRCAENGIRPFFHLSGQGLASHTYR